jgi:hypothetical protein
VIRERPKLMGKRDKDIAIEFVTVISVGVLLVVGKLI